MSVVATTSTELDFGVYTFIESTPWVYLVLYQSSYRLLGLLGLLYNGYLLRLYYNEPTYQYFISVFKFSKWAHIPFFIIADFYVLRVFSFLIES